MRILTYGYGYYCMITRIVHGSSRFGFGVKSTTQPHFVMCYFLALVAYGWCHWSFLSLTSGLMVGGLVNGG